MEVTSYLNRSYRNLRVYRCASLLAIDLFWITRRFPPAEQKTLTDQLRRTARAIPYNVLRAWQKRYQGPGFRNHLDEAQSACARLDLWLHMAYESFCLSDDEHTCLQARRRHMQRMLTRFHAQRLIMLDTGYMGAAMYEPDFF